MKRRSRSQARSAKTRVALQAAAKSKGRRNRSARPAAAYRQRGLGGSHGAEPFYAHEDWHEPIGREETKLVVQDPGRDYLHAVTIDEIRQRLDRVPSRFTDELEVVQLSRMTRKRRLFPCYGMQWGPNIYLYPIEESLVESYIRPPRPNQVVEARMYGGKWYQDGSLWRLEWSEKSIKDFYLNNVLIHELGHVNDHRNRNFDARERYADWFAIEYGYRRK